MHKKWHDKWQIKNAEFSEVDYVMTVTIELEDGTVYEDLDCTPMDGYVVAGVDIPPEAQKNCMSLPCLGYGTQTRCAEILQF